MFKNVPILIKTLIAPVVASILTLVIAGTVWMNHQESQVQVANVQKAAAAIDRIKQLGTVLAASNTDMYRSVALVESQQEAEVIELSMDRARKALKTVDGLAKSLKVEDFGDMPEAHKEVVAVLDNFVVTAGQGLDFVEIDSFLATMNLQSSYDNFAELLAIIEKVTSHLREQEAAAEEAFLNSGTQAVNFALILTFASIAIGMTIAILMARAISGPVNEVTATIGRLADNDLTVDVTGADRKDEIGKIAGAVEVLKQNAIERQEARKAQEIEDQKIIARQKKLMDLTVAFDNTITEALQYVQDSVNGLEQTSVQMSQTVKEANVQTDQANAATNAAAANVDAVSAASTQLSASIQEISQRVNQASGQSQQAVSQANETNQGIQALVRSANEIGAVVDLIREIAEQTNLLALNATIESARAGEVGKGFAVVASEVKNLAGQTSRATDDIADKIRAIQSETENAVQAIRHIGTSIDSVNELSLNVASAIEEQSSATDEIARSAEQAAGGTRQVSENVSSVAESAVQTESMASEVNQAAEDLKQRNRQLKTDVDQFLETVRNMD